MPITWVHKESEHQQHRVAPNYSGFRNTFFLHTIAVAADILAIQGAGASLAKAWAQFTRNITVWAPDNKSGSLLVFKLNAIAKFLFLKNNLKVIVICCIMIRQHRHWIMNADKNPGISCHKAHQLLITPPGIILMGLLEVPMAGAIDKIRCYNLC